MYTKERKIHLWKTGKICLIRFNMWDHCPLSREIMVSEVFMVFISFAWIRYIGLLRQFEVFSDKSIAFVFSDKDANFLQIYYLLSEKRVFLRTFLFSRHLWMFVRCYSWLYRPQFAFCRIALLLVWNHCKSQQITMVYCNLAQMVWDTGILLGLCTENRSDWVELLCHLTRKIRNLQLLFFIGLFLFLKLQNIRKTNILSSSGDF